MAFQKKVVLQIGAELFHVTPSEAAMAIQALGAARRVTAAVLASSPVYLEADRPTELRTIHCDKLMTTEQVKKAQEKIQSNSLTSK